MSRHRVFRRFPNLSQEPIATTDTPVAPCPACGVNLEQATGTGQPTPGTITLCVYCAVLLIFTDTMALRVLTDAEWLALDDEYRAILTRVRDEWVKTELYAKKRRD